MGAALAGTGNTARCDLATLLGVALMCCVVLWKSAGVKLKVTATNLPQAGKFPLPLYLLNGGLHKGSGNAGNGRETKLKFQIVTNKQTNMK